MTPSIKTIPELLMRHTETRQKSLGAYRAIETQSGVICTTKKPGITPSLTAF
ncbi:hypothetical protein SeSB_B0106 [Salmonella enterica subsp. enterica serovar Schwarzengrund str. SL480]|nr:hypothetical protein SeSB_B0106 [Salmonella enterica subsp. enterica serovar Schwarzengrund str. SL480]